MTPADICTAALKAIGVTAQGETPSAADAADAYARLNRLLDQWAIQRQTINGVQKFPLAVTASQSPYTIGSGGDFNQARPTWIQAVTLALATSPAVDLPVELIDSDTYAAIPNKTTGAQVAMQVYYDSAFPLGNLYFWPVLNDATVTIGLWLPVAIVQFTSQTQTITLLPGYQSALELNLAVVLAPEFGRPVDPNLAMQAAAAVGFIKRANTQIGLLQCDPGITPSNGYIRGGANWFVGP